MYRVLKEGHNGVNLDLLRWMFITPNMTNDGHDSSVIVAGNWARNFLEPLLTNEVFMNNTFIMLSKCLSSLEPDMAKL